MGILLDKIFKKKILMDQNIQNIQNFIKDIILESDSRLNIIY